MKKLFGTDGIRGAVNSEHMSADFAVRFGQSLVQYCRDKSVEETILIGRDTRGSGIMLEMAVAAGIISAGGKPIFLGLIPTPGVAYWAKKQERGLGLMISASHNNYGDNGLKLFKNDGTKLTDTEEIELEKIINSEKEIKKGKEFICQDIYYDSSLDNQRYRDEYSNFLLSVLPQDFDCSDLRIVLDCANGATFQVAPETFAKLNMAGVETLFCTPDGTNINDGCGSQHTEKLSEAVKLIRANVGLAFDGDGDRLIAVDENGRTLTGDQLIYIFARLLLDIEKMVNKKVVTTVMSNINLIRKLKEHGVDHISTDVGDRPVSFAMKEHGSIVGGEECGHIIFSHHHTTGDGLLGALMLIWAMKHFDKPLSELADELKLAPKILINVPVKEKVDIDLIPEICDAIKTAEEILLDSGRVLIRYSGTELLCRVMVEGEDEDEINRIANNIAQAIRKNLS